MSCLKQTLACTLLGSGANPPLAKMFIITMCSTSLSAGGRWSMHHTPMFILSLSAGMRKCCKTIAAPLFVAAIRNPVM